MGMEGTKQNNSCTNQHSVDPSPGGDGGVGGGGGWMGMEGTKQNNPCTNQHSIDPSPGHYRVQTTNNDVEILGLTKNMHVIIHTLK